MAKNKDKKGKKVKAGKAAKKSSVKPNAAKKKPATAKISPKKQGKKPAVKEKKVKSKKPLSASKKNKEAKEIIPIVKKSPGKEKNKKELKQVVDLNPTKKPDVKTTPDKPEKNLNKKDKAPKPKKIIKSPTILPNQLIEKAIIASTKKEPKGKYELEFNIRCSPGVLFEFLSTPSGLSEWFADNVNIKDEVFTFFWDGSQQQAKVVGLKDETFIRFQWVDKKDGSYFEFKIQVDELTGDVSIIVTDFAENESEKASAKLLWESQIDKLMQVLGSYS